MQRPDYALQVVRHHFNKVRQPAWNDGFTALELGPGDSLFSALTASALGAREVLLVDTGAYADAAIEPYLRAAAWLAEQGYAVPDLAGARALPEILRRCNARYLTDGLDSLRSLPAASVDFIFSQAVMEHVGRGEFAATQRELKRILSPCGRCSHQVDYRDHFNGDWNNLRFPTPVWESGLFKKAGFYTNRIGYSEMLQEFRAAGFTVESAEPERRELPGRIPRFAREFRDRSGEDLRTIGADVTLI